MRIAHISDLHLLAIDGVARRRLLTNKRVTGYLNLLLGRSKKHRLDILHAVATDLAKQGVDHLVVTGDLTNLSLDEEFEAVRALIEQSLGYGGEKVSLVPGNHDRYTRGSARTNRFERHFESYLHSDIACEKQSFFPFVHLRGPAAIVGLSSAVAQLPFVAAGELGDRQLADLAHLLREPEVSTRTLVLLVHHPIRHAKGRLHAWLEGLRDGRKLLEVLQSCAQGLVLHGHLHRRVLRMLPTRAGVLWSIGATSASLHDGRDGRMAGYNMYELSDDGRIGPVSARMLDVNTWDFTSTPVPVARE